MIIIKIGCSASDGWRQIAGVCMLGFSPPLLLLDSVGQSIEDSSQLQELVVVSLLDDLPLVEHVYYIALLNCAQTMGYYDGRHTSY